MTDTIAKKQAEQTLIEDYRNKVQETQGWLDSLGKRLDGLQKGSSLDCAQKITELSEIENELNENGLPKVDQVKSLANQVMAVVNNLDSQQVEEQVFYPFDLFNFFLVSLALVFLYRKCVNFLRNP